MYIHKIARINYTTYDMRRAQDAVNPRTHSDIMMLAPDSEDSGHPYLYARVLGIFHVNAYLAPAHYGTDSQAQDPEPQLVQVLWVRWFELDNSAPGGFLTRRPYRVRFVDANDGAFDFISPDRVLRGVHLIPAFAHGRSDATLRGPSLVRPEDDDDEDWNFHYVGM